MDKLNILFLVSLPMVAFLYASVGHGGASGYFALAALLGMHVQTLKADVLILNCLVAGIAFYYYYKSEYFNWKLFLPFAVGSVPASFIGALIPIEILLYKKILGVCLIISVVRLLAYGSWKEFPIRKNNFIVSLIIGVFIGLLSGMIGIGGGIILSPIILLLHWGNMKETAAVSSLFILVNSIASLIGGAFKGYIVDTIRIDWILLALIGGFLGSYYGSQKLNILTLRIILALVLSLASFKLIVV